MQKHIASHTLASMEQRADLSGSAHAHTTTHEDGEPVCLTIELTGPAKYRYCLTYCGRYLSEGHRIAVTERIERRDALKELCNTEGDRVHNNGTTFWILPA